MAGIDDLLAKYGGGGAAAAPGNDIDSVLSKYEQQGAELQPTKDVSYGESALRGIKQGVTLGFGDEITGALESAFTNKTYRQARDEARANDEAARAANPLTFGASEIGGGLASMFVPGLNVAKAATVGGRIAGSAVLGAVGAVGSSDAEDVGGLATAAAGGGALGAVGGAALEGVGRLIAGAPRRAENRLIQGITEGAKPSAGEKLVGVAGQRRPEVVEFLRSEPGLARAARSGDADALYKATQASSEKLGTARKIMYDRIDGTGEKIPLRSVMRRLDDAAAELETSPATIKQGDAIRKSMDDVWRAWGESKPQLTARELREEVTKLQTEARSYYRAAITGGVAPEAAEAKKVAADSLRDLLHEHVEAVAAKHAIPGVGLAELKSLNKRISILADIEDAAATKATREAKVPPHRLGWMGDVALGVTQPLALVAKKVLVDSGMAKEAAMIGDDVLARYVTAAKNGARGGKLKAAAAQLGIGAAASDALGLWAQDKFGEASGP